MLTVRLEPLDGEAHVIGPTPSLRIVRASLRAGPEDAEVASYLSHQWHVAGRYFITGVVQAPVVVRFEAADGTRSAPHGPFERVKLIDGALWSGSAAGRLLARFDEGSQSWHVYAENARYPVIILEAVP